MRRIRVLLIAEACNPEWTSVPLVGYNLYRALRDVVDVTLVTQIRNRPALLRHVEPSERIEFIDSELMAAPFHRLGRVLTFGKGLGWTTKQAVGWLPYLYFEHLVYNKFRRALRKGEYDIVHRITPLTPTYPSPIASWTSVPFVLGPINGGLPWPKGTTRTRLAEMEWLSYFRDVYRVMPFVRRTYERAACVLAGSKYTLSALPGRTRQRAVYMPENGIDATRFNAEGRIPPAKIKPFRILFAGRLVPYKGADVLLDAFASSRLLRCQAELVVVGDGPQRPKLQALAAGREVGDRVTFVGRLPQPELPRYFREASVFAFPSVREFGGGVVMEAMACGLPCVVVKHGGPAEVVTAETGRLLSLGPREKMVDELRQCLESLCASPSLLRDLSISAVNAARAYTWGAKASQTVDVYRRVLANRRDKPLCSESKEQNEKLWDTQKQYGRRCSAR